MSRAKTISETENEIIREFSLLQSWDDKYEHIINTGRKLSPCDSIYKTEENKIKGCQSDVWFVANFENGKIYFTADSDAAIVKGLAAMLIRVLSGHSPEEILNAKLDFVDAIGMRQHLAPSRSNGLRYMIVRLKSYAMAFHRKKHAQKPS